MITQIIYFSSEFKPKRKIVCIKINSFCKKEIYIFRYWIIDKLVWDFNSTCSLFVFEIDQDMEGNTTFSVFASNGSFNNSSCSRNNVFKTVVLPVLYSCLFLLGMILNCLAAWVLFHIPSRSYFIIYLKNIVVADVIMTLTFPFKVSYIYKAWWGLWGL